MKRSHAADEVNNTRTEDEVDSRCLQAMAERLHNMVTYINVVSCRKTYSTKHLREDIYLTMTVTCVRPI